LFIQCFSSTNQQDNYRIGKKYWKYVKSRKRETVGVPTLKVNGETIENSKGKAEALNEQFSCHEFIKILIIVTNIDKINNL
jgi:hypothetical protein